MLTFGWNPGEKSDFQSDMWGYVVNSYIKIQLMKQRKPKNAFISSYRLENMSCSVSYMGYFVLCSYYKL